MADKTPVRVVFNSDNVATGMAEFQTGESVPVANGGTGLTAIGSAGQIIKVNAAGNALEFGAETVELEEVWSRLRATLGSIWGPFGVDLGSTWGRLGVDLGSIGDRLGIDLESVWRRLWGKAVEAQGNVVEV